MVKAKEATKQELQDGIREIWETAQSADGSRGGMQDALDQIQELCSDLVPDVEDEDGDTDEDDSFDEDDD